MPGQVCPARRPNARWSEARRRAAAPHQSASTRTHSPGCKPAIIAELDAELVLQPPHYNTTLSRLASIGGDAQHEFGWKLGITPKPRAALGKVYDQALRAPAQHALNTAETIESLARRLSAVSHNSAIIPAYRLSTNARHGAPPHHLSSEGPRRVAPSGSVSRSSQPIDAICSRAPHPVAGRG